LIRHRSIQGRTKGTKAAPDVLGLLFFELKQRNPLWVKWADRALFVGKQYGVTLPRPFFVAELIWSDAKGGDHAVKPSYRLGGAAGIKVEVIIHDALVQWRGMSHGCNELKYAHHISQGAPAEVVKGILNKSIKT
jgi:hypothetical protein